MSRLALKKIAKIPNWAINLGMAIVSLIAGATICEVGLRLANIKGLMKADDANLPPEAYHQLDPDLGWSLKPNAKVWWRKEGSSYVKINSQGLRDDDHSFTKPKNTIRIAVLGDSFTEAVQVEIAETYWLKTENKLNRCEAVSKAKKKVEVINFGVFGYGTAQQLIQLRQKVWQYQPDVVLLGFFIGNDIVNNSKQLEPAAYRPFFVYDENDKLVLDNSFRQFNPLERNRYGHLMIDKLPAKVINSVRLLQILRKFEFDSKKRQAENELLANVPKNLTPPTDETWQEAWDITESLLTTMAKEVKAKGAQFVLATIGEPIQSLPNPYLRDDFVKKHQINDIFYPDKRLKNLGDRMGFQVINLTPELQRYAEGTQTCLYGFDQSCMGHWNANGHRIGSQIIARQLCETWSKLPFLKLKQGKE